MGHMTPAQQRIVELVSRALDETSSQEKADIARRLGVSTETVRRWWRGEVARGIPEEHWTGLEVELELPAGTIAGAAGMAAPTVDRDQIEERLTLLVRHADELAKEADALLRLVAELP